MNYINNKMDNILFELNFLALYSVTKKERLFFKKRYTNLYLVILKHSPLGLSIEQQVEMFCK